MKKIIKVKNEEVAKEIVVTERLFPKHVRSLINLANKSSQGTRPKVVGQLTEIIKECPKKDYKGWVEWYKNKYPQAIENATQKIAEMMDDEEGKKIFNILANEEKNHQQILEHEIYHISNKGVIIWD